jgi:hypothetical protein
MALAQAHRKSISRTGILVVPIIICTELHPCDAKPRWCELQMGGAVIATRLKPQLRPMESAVIATNGTGRDCDLTN